MSKKRPNRGGKPARKSNPPAAPAPQRPAPFLNGYLPSGRPASGNPPVPPAAAVPPPSTPPEIPEAAAMPVEDRAATEPVAEQVPEPAAVAAASEPVALPAETKTGAAAPAVAETPMTPAAPPAAKPAPMATGVMEELAGGTGIYKPPAGWLEVMEQPFVASGWFPDGRPPEAVTVRIDALPDAPVAAALGGGAARAEAMAEEVEAMCPEGRRMYIVMITPEVAPAAKVGGLGDMVVGLGRALEKRGHRVEVVVPMYDGLRRECVENLQCCWEELWVPHGATWNKEKVFHGKVSGLDTFFVTGGLYTLRPNIYGYPDDLRRFAYFTRGALEFLYKSGRRPDILHAHDWGTALAPVLLCDLYEKLGWNRTRTVFTIHNHETQGLTHDYGNLLGLVGLDWRNYMRPDRLQDDTRKNCINLMKGAIVYSNFVTAVSPTYAGEIKTPLGGRGLNGVLSTHSAKVGGVINGIDYDIWNPETDRALAANYSVSDNFVEKYKNKYELRSRLNLADCWKPIVSVITRLTEQKGLGLIRSAIHQLPQMEAQVVLLGSAPDPKVDAEFKRMAYELGHNRDINLWLGYNEDLAHLIYAGSDLFLIPSLYEPCGLTQMISMRYGTVPVVRKTGGLADTVMDPMSAGRGMDEANGFVFEAATPEAMGAALHRAVRTWYEDPQGFERLARNGMHRDFSWRYPAQDYENIYQYIRA